jgi:hypothetical protein
VGLCLIVDFLTPRGKLALLELFLKVEFNVLWLILKVYQFRKLITTVKIRIGETLELGFDPKR